MIVVGYWLYDRGIKIVSFQTLMIAVGLLLPFFPRLFFSLSFWFSTFGVLSIFIFVRYYEHWKAWQIFLALNRMLFSTVADFTGDIRNIQLVAYRLDIDQFDF